MVALSVRPNNSDVVDLTKWTHERLDWHLRICCDPNLRDRAKLLASLLLHDFDLRKGGCAWRGQNGENSLSERAGWKEPRTVQLAAQELEAAGYLRIERGRGRGRSNHYWPVFEAEKAHGDEPFSAEKAHVDEPFEGPEKAHEDEPFSAEKAHPDPLKGVRTYALHRKDSSNSLSERAREFDEIVEECPPGMLQFADLGLARDAFETLCDAGQDPAVFVPTLRWLKASEKYRSRKHPPQLHDWLRKGMWRGWLAEREAAERDTAAPETPPRIGVVGPDPLRVAILGALGADFALTLDRCAWAPTDRGGRLTPATGWAHGRLATIQNLLTEHGVALAAPRGTS